MIEIQSMWIALNLEEKSCGNHKCSCLVTLKVLLKTNFAFPCLLKTIRSFCVSFKLKIALIKMVWDFKVWSNYLVFFFQITKKLGSKNDNGTHSKLICPNIYFSLPRKRNAWENWIKTETENLLLFFSLIFNAMMLKYIANQSEVYI